MEAELKGLQKFDLIGVHRCYTEYEITLTALPWGLLKDFCSFNYCDVMFRMTPTFITAYLIVYLKRVEGTTVEELFPSYVCYLVLVFSFMVLSCICNISFSRITLPYLKYELSLQFDVTYLEASPLFLGAEKSCIFLGYLGYQAL